MKKIVLTVIAVILLEIIAIIIGVYSGIPDVSATKPSGSIVDWFLNTTKDNSIRSHARNIAVPSLADSILAATGFEHYDELCVTCHGAPGKGPEKFAKGLNPPAPDLRGSITDLSPEEVFLIVKNGIKMTGMPAWGPSNSDSTIWSMVAFLQRLPALTPETYKAYKIHHLSERR
jgi:mono/diheme cytochrome c family protein